MTHSFMPIRGGFNQELPTGFMTGTKPCGSRKLNHDWLDLKISSLAKVLYYLVLLARNLGVHDWLELGGEIPPSFES